MAIEQYVSDSRMMAWEKNKTGLRDKEEYLALVEQEMKRPKIDGSNGNENKMLKESEVR